MDGLLDVGLDGWGERVLEDEGPPKLLAFRFVASRQHELAELVVAHLPG